MMGMATSVAPEVGDLIEVGVTMFGSGDESERELVLLNCINASSVGLTKNQAIELAKSLLDATDMLDAAPTDIMTE